MSGGGLGKASAESRDESRKARSNRARSESTRSALLDAARALFADKGYADTSTPEIVQRAGVTRGALYHHFADKEGLFRAVIEREAVDLAERIADDTVGVAGPVEAMLAGADAYFDAMAEPGRSRLLLLEGPAVLGIAAMSEIDRRTGGGELREGLAAAVATREGARVPLDALASTLSAAFDKAALDVAAGASADEYKRALRILMYGIPGLEPEATD
jgi:AcrR family transcriptional regulator